MRKSLLIFLLLVHIEMVESAPDVTMSFSSASGGSTITASEHNTVRNETSSRFNSHDHNDIDQTASTLNIGASSGATSISASSLIFEGATSDGNEITFSITDPTADRTITVPNASGVILPTGAIFFMITGSCPPGTTNVSATYSNRFIRINATAGTTGGADTDSITLTSNELPAHTHSTPAHSHTFSGNSDFTNTGTGQYARGDDNNAGAPSTNTDGAGTSGSSGSGNAFSVDTVPSFVTAILCQVD